MSLQFPGDSVITGRGHIYGRTVFVFSQVSITLYCFTECTSYRRKYVCGKVMFSRASVCTQGRGGGEKGRSNRHGIGHMIRVHPGKGQVGYPLAIRPWEMLVTCDIDHWKPVQTCSFGTPNFPREQHLVVATETEARAVSRWAVCILLECFLVTVTLIGDIFTHSHYYIYNHTCK